MRDKAHSSLEDVDAVIRREKEASTYYGLCNMDKWNKIKNEYKYFIIIPISKLTVRVVKYTNDEKKAEYITGLDPRYVLIGDWD